MMNLAAVDDIEGMVELGLPPVTHTGCLCVQLLKKRQAEEEHAHVLLSTTLMSRKGLTTRARVTLSSILSYVK